jgi:hypothetical protein
MVAIVLTGVVALTAFGTGRVSVDARARLDAELDAAQSTRAMRELLRGSLRNAVAPRTAGDTTFALRDGRLSFVAAGVGAPFDPEYDWRVTIAPDSGRGSPSTQRRSGARRRRRWRSASRASPAGTFSCSPRAPVPRPSGYGSGARPR